MSREGDGPERDPDQDREPTPPEDQVAQPDGSTDSVPVPGRRRLERVAASSRSREASAYQGAMEAVFAIVIAALLGYWADSRFGTSPRWLIVGVVIGFASFVLRLMRMAKLLEDPHEDAAAEHEDPKAEGPKGPEPEGGPGNEPGSGPRDHR